MSDDLVNTGKLFDLQAQSAFVYVKIPITRHSIADPFHQREHELANRLQDAAAGTVIGWGQSMSDAADDGEQHLMHQRIDITTQDLARTREYLRQLLMVLAVPAGTEIHYTLAGQPYMDIYLWQQGEQAHAKHGHKPEGQAIAQRDEIQHIQHDEWRLGVGDN